MAAFPIAAVDSVDSLIARNQVAESTFVQFETSLVPLSAGASVPESAIAVIQIARWTDGRPLRHLELPVSESGDWHLEFAHYFGPDGRTTSFIADGTFFRDGCGSGVVWDHRVVTFDDQGGPSLPQRRLTDTHRVSVDSAECGEGPYKEFFAGEPRPSFAALVQAGRAK